MARAFASTLLIPILKAILGVKEKPIPHSADIHKILIVRQHNQLGDMLVGSSLITALHEAYPGAKITFIASPQNKAALETNSLLQCLFVFDKKKITDPRYFRELWSVLHAGYDVCFAPATVSISFTNDLLARLSDAKYRVGVASLDGKENAFAFFFHNRVTIDWRAHEGTHVARRILGILAPFGFSTNALSPVIKPTPADEANAVHFLRSLPGNGPIVGLHTGAGKPPNRWPAENFISLIELLQTKAQANCYLTASSADLPIIEKINAGLKTPLPVYLDKSIGSVAAVIGRSKLFITNDTGIMHVAAAVPIPQISLFGPTDPRVWAPVGQNKAYLMHASSINEISVDEVFSLAQKLL